MAPANKAMPCCEANKVTPQSARYALPPFYRRGYEVCPRVGFRFSRQIPQANSQNLEVSALPKIRLSIPF